MYLAKLANAWYNYTCTMPITVKACSCCNLMQTPVDSGPETRQSIGVALCKSEAIDTD